MIDKKTASRIKQLLKKHDCGKVAKILGLGKTRVWRFAKRENIKLLYKEGERATYNGKEIVAFFNKHGLESTVLKFKKDSKKVMQIVYNFRHKEKVGR